MTRLSCQTIYKLPNSIQKIVFRINLVLTTFCIEVVYNFSVQLLISNHYNVHAVILCQQKVWVERNSIFSGLQDTKQQLKSRLRTFSLRYQDRSKMSHMSLIDKYLANPLKYRINLSKEFRVKDLDCCQGKMQNVLWLNSLDLKKVQTILWIIQFQKHGCLPNSNKWCCSCRHIHFKSSIVITLTWQIQPHG